MTYLTAEKLGIEEWEFTGLAWFVEFARLGKLKPVSNLMIDTMGNEKGKNQPLFNMSIVQKNLECGSVACIGGYVFLHEHGAELDRDQAKLLHYEAMRYVGERKGTLKNLYYPWDSGVYYTESMETDLEHVADVVEFFLTTGKVDWRRMV